MLRIANREGGLKGKAGSGLRQVSQLLCALLAAGLVPGMALGAPAVPKTTKVVAPPSNRWLFVVETSKMMAPRARAVAQTAASLAWTGFNGQMRPHDTLGMWTFNESVSMGRFPLQEWVPGMRQDIAERVFGFLCAQKFEKGARIDQALARISRIVRNSDYITVILITDGSEQIHGTPFDAKINGAFRSWSKVQEQSNSPFITVLRAEHGWINGYTVATPPWPIEMPPLPAVLAKIPLSPPPPRLAPVEEPAIGAPIIVHGNEPQPATAPAAQKTAPAAPASFSATALPVQARTIQSKPAAPAPSPAPPAAATPRPEVAVVSASQPSILSRWSLWAGLGAITFVGLGLILFFVRRPRPAPPIRLVIQSQDRRNRG